MRTWIPRRRLAAGLVATVVVLAACGGGETVSSSAASNDDTTTTAAAAPADGADDAGAPADEGSDDCSAAELDEDVAEPSGLPAPVAAMRKEILKAAVRCDFELLEALALRGDGTFQYSYGQPGPAGSAAFWRDREAAGEPVTAVLVRLLQLDPRHRQPREDEGPGTGSDVGAWTWPRADTERPSQAEWDELDSVYPGTERDVYRRGDSYVGHRLAITDQGDWVSFVGGD